MRGEGTVGEILKGAERKEEIADRALKLKWLEGIGSVPLMSIGRHVHDGRVLT